MAPDPSAAAATIAATSAATATPSLQALSASSQLWLRVRLLLLGSATRLRGLRGAARQAPGVKLRPSLGSGENLLMLGAAQGGDRGPVGRGWYRFQFLRAVGVFLPDLGPAGARRLEKGLVGILATEQETELGVPLRISARTKFGFRVSFLSV